MNTTDEIDHYWMMRALELADKAEMAGEVPVGAILVDEHNQFLAEGFNRPIQNSDPTAHAEIQCLRAAAKHLQNYRLPNTTLYVTIEPCTMCVGALLHARIARLVFGASEPKAGAVISRQQLLNASYFNHHVTYTAGVLADLASDKIQRFFKNKRHSGNNNN